MNPAASAASASMCSPVNYKYLDPDNGYYGSKNIVIAESITAPSTMTYSISGKQANKASKVLIRVWVTSPNHLTIGRSRLNSAAAHWFKFAGAAMPTGLPLAVKTGKNFQGKSAGVSVEYIVEVGSGKPIVQTDGSLYKSVFMDLTIRPEPVGK